MRREAHPKGFTLIEVVAVLGILMSVAAIAIPALRYALVRSRAARIVSDFTFFRTALAQYQNDTGQSPADTGVGVEPNGLQRYLDGKLQWQNPNFAFEWENWEDADGNLTQPGTGVRYGLTVRTTDPVLLTMLRNSWQGAPAMEIAGYGYVFIIDGGGGSASNSGSGSGSSGSSSSASNSSGSSSSGSGSSASNSSGGSSSGSGSSASNSSGSSSSGSGSSASNSSGSSSSGSGSSGSSSSGSSSSGSSNSGSSNSGNGNSGNGNNGSNGNGNSNGNNGNHYGTTGGNGNTKK